MLSFSPIQVFDRLIHCCLLASFGVGAAPRISQGAAPVSHRVGGWGFAMEFDKDKKRGNLNAHC